MATHLVWVSRLFCAVLFVAVATAASGQTGGTFLGSVKDDQGLALPGATVTLTNLDTGWTRAIVTDEGGRYRAVALPPGVYEIKAELVGFATAVRNKVPLALGQELTIDMSVRVATVEETITVTAAAPLIEVTSNTLGTSVSREQLDALPVPGRTFTALAQTAPGVTGVGGGGVNAGGQLNRNNSFRIDGVSNENNVLASPRGGVSMEAIREYVVISNQFSAEYGDASGAVINVVTRTGTNNVDGRGFLFHRDESFDAQDPFSKAQGSGKAPFSQQRFGGFLGGPIKRDRMHYFGNYEGVRLDQTAVISSPLVPPSEREVPNNETGDQYFFRVDNRLTDNHSIFVRYRYDEATEINNGAGGLDTAERGVDSINRNQDAVFSHTAVLTSRVLNELRVQFGRHFADNVIHVPLFSPTINRPSGNFGKPANQPQGRTEDRWQLVNNFTYTLSAHSLKFGVDYSHIRTTSYFHNNTGGTFTFANDLPFDPNNLTTYPTQFTQNIGDPNLLRRNDTIGLFAQDSWRMASTFTLNYGLRYDRENAFKEATGVPDAKLNFAPRVGFAWDPFNDQKTVIRGGAGQYYSKVFLNITGNIMLARRFIGVNIANPGYPDPYARGTQTAPVPSTTISPDEVKTPVSRQLSIGMKREIGAGMALSADYVNSRGRNLYNAPDVNAPDPITGLRLDPSFLRVVQYQANGNSWYNALLLGLERRSGRGPQLGISYTLSKQDRDVEDFGFTPQDNYDRAAEKAAANNDRRHQLVVNIVYAMPWGMQIGLFTQARSGLPFNVTTGLDNNRDGQNTTDRPDLANPDGDPLDPATYAGTFTGRSGDLPRNFARGPMYAEAHLRLSKMINLARAKLDRLEVFVEALNVTNHANFATPTGNIRSAAFGKGTQIHADSSPRRVELGFRLDF